MHVLVKREHHHEIEDVFLDGVRTTHFSVNLTHAGVLVGDDGSVLVQILGNAYQNKYLRIRDKENVRRILGVIEHGLTALDEERT